MEELQLLLRVIRRLPTARRIPTAEARREGLQSAQLSRGVLVFGMRTDCPLSDIPAVFCVPVAKEL
jgi:hypothetical protein